MIDGVCVCMCGDSCGWLLVVGCYVVVMSWSCCGS